MGDKIENNESIKDLEKQVKGVKFLRPLAKIIGAKLPDELKNIEKDFAELKVLPDKFNELYSEKGWISHETMNIDVMKSTILEAEKGNFNKGELMLTEYYEEKLRSFDLISYRKFFVVRRDILNLAVEDYFSERYHASVPVVLMMADGIINDVKATGLFADSTNLDVWDSISGHPSGLGKVVAILKKNRKRTNTEEIKLPYRNGILHGRDLGYNNKPVAIKSFAILYYVADWIQELSTESSRKSKRENEQKEITIKEVALKLKKSRQDNKKAETLLEKWNPRFFSSIPDKFEESSPEFTANKFLEYIAKGNFGSPVGFYSKNLYVIISTKEKAGRLREEFKNISIIGYSIVEILDEAPAITVVEADVEFKMNNYSEVVGRVEFRLIYEIDGQISNRLNAGGRWTIYNIEGIAFQLKKGLNHS